MTAASPLPRYGHQTARSFAALLLPATPQAGTRPFRDAAVVLELRIAAAGHRLQAVVNGGGLHSPPPRVRVGLVSVNSVSSPPLTPSAWKQRPPSLSGVSRDLQSGLTKASRGAFELGSIFTPRGVDVRNCRLRDPKPKLEQFAQWMRGAPQSGFPTLIRLINTRSSASTCGRPPFERDFQRQ